MVLDNTNPKAAAPASNLELPPELQALYVNLVRISHSPAEIVFDFAQILPGQLQTSVRSRLVMSPVGAKLFFHALGDNLARYEASFGEIPTPNNNLALASELFHPTQHPPESNPKKDPPPKT